MIRILKFIKYQIDLYITSHIIRFHALDTLPISHSI